ncbi:hypothetical protein HPB50_014334 [Hyalomma asiaticum]|uniref:Uncharacterized protein n=1 Tax=Hyalomma asiaticum TaxID=266040 RepID=A0ACB7RV87_HYAAI|nr:hypothetical protein HPB50_014334 [Hyalomma asiaticum]
MRDTEVIYGDYFDHLIPWYERRNDPNVFFVTYEDLKADTKGQVLKMADFFGEEYGAALREDDALLEKVLQSCSLDSMKQLFNDKPMERVKKIVQTATEKSASFEMLKDVPKQAAELHEGAGFVRKGIVGDWKNYFTQEQIKQTKEWIERKTERSDVMTLWQDCDIP